MDAVQRAREDEKKKLLEIKTFAQLQSCVAKIQLVKSWRLWETESEMHVYHSLFRHRRYLQTRSWMCAPIPYSTAFSETQMIQLVEPKGGNR